MAQADDPRIRQMIEAATQAGATGRPYDAERLVRQAETEAPNHPLVLNEVGKRRLLAGDAAGGLAALEQALKAEPGNPAFLLNLAPAYRNLDRRDEELAAPGTGCWPRSPPTCAPSSRPRPCTNAWTIAPRRPLIARP